jgi:hypothetical protein
MGTKVSKQLATVIRDVFPGDEGRKIRAALNGGPEWKIEPECFNDWSTAAVENDGNWTTYLHELGYRVEDGVLYTDLWSCSAGDDDWEVADNVDMTSPEYAGWVDRIVAEDEASWVEYAKGVAATGEDPLNNYCIGKTTKPVKWQFVISNTINGLALTKLRRQRGEWITLAKAPQALRDFFQPDDLKQFASLADLKKIDTAADGIKWMRDPDINSIMGIREFEEDLPDATIERRLIAAAKKHIREKRSK